MSEADTRVSNLPVLQAIRHKRGSHREISRAAAELVESELGVTRKQWKPDFRKQFVLGQGG